MEDVDTPMEPQQWSVTVGNKAVKDEGRHFALEVFCGSAGLTAELQTLGCQAFGVDREDNVHTPKSEVLHINLSTDAGRALFRRLLDHPRLVYVHFAPPCGTASRARERRVGRDHHGPPPLRSEEHPYGLPSLGKDHPHALARVLAANGLYDFVVEIAKLMTNRKVPWTLENPGNSLFWLIPGVIDLLDPEVGDIFLH